MAAKKAHKSSVKKPGRKRVAMRDMQFAGVSGPWTVSYRRTRAMRGGAGKSRELLAQRLGSLVDHFTDEAVQAALSRDDVSAIATLASPEAWRESVDPLHAARLRGAGQHDDMLKQAGGVLTTAEAAELLDVSEEAVRKRIREGSLIGIRRGRGYMIPSVQIREGDVVPGLSRVLRAMTIASPWARLSWLLNPEPRLDGRRPVDVLASGGDREAVESAASMVGEQGAA